MTLRDNIYQYLYLKGDRIENYYDTLVENYRVLKADELDYVELIIAKARRDLFREIQNDILIMARGDLSCLSV